MGKAQSNKVRSRDFPIIDRIFGMEHGYVLDFSNRTFENFFIDELNVDIYAEEWAEMGTSKANRLRCYLLHVDSEEALRVLDELWDYRESSGVITDYPELEPKLIAAYTRIVNRLKENSGEPLLDPVIQPKQTVNVSASTGLAEHLLVISNMRDLQARGFAFEKFLKDTFDIYGMSAHASFRIRGEQIDGSFQLDAETYLLEARWRNAPANVTDLHAFNGKVEDKASWTRGLFVSQSGFTKDGLHAFGGGKRVVCMDGFDLHESLNSGIHLADVIALKVRHAAETGMPYISVRELDLPRRN